MRADSRLVGRPNESHLSTRMVPIDADAADHDFVDEGPERDAVRERLRFAFALAGTADSSS